LNNEIINAVNVLKFEGTILYPTDTIWGIGCDALSNIAVEKIFKIKKREYSKSLICLASNFKMIQEYVQLKKLINLKNSPKKNLLLLSLIILAKFQNMF